MGLLGSTQFIAEVKTKSPFGYQADKSFNELFTIANAIGDMVSIHTDRRWGGSFYNLTRVRSKTDKPILAKGIHATDDEVRYALDCGADAVLVVGRLPQVSLREICFIEPVSLSQLRRFAGYLDTMVWNSRDLRHGGLKRTTFDIARQAFEGTLIQASNISQLSYIHPAANGVIIGQSLERVARQLLSPDKPTRQE